MADSRSEGRLNWRAPTESEMAHRAEVVRLVAQRNLRFLAWVCSGEPVNALWVEGREESDRAVDRRWPYLTVRCEVCRVTAWDGPNGFAQPLGSMQRVEIRVLAALWGRGCTHLCRLHDVSQDIVMGRGQDPPEIERLVGAWWGKT